MPIQKLLTSDEQWKKFCDQIAGNLRSVKDRNQRLRLLIELSQIEEREHALFNTSKKDTSRSEAEHAFYAH
ncbi:hypothetical protein HJ526_11045 [Donghicola sp. C2-DW-16]|uniref:Uncharacterized protein n=1 Tax=Donghicola mangrovi TaxID=2729614 RepID=A0A850Q623_9RHOB|nr:hypothetical protein [Donghicola mangrovi]NVO25187.1 hypothetical protein [Donghicola mangrovi]NVO27959.1 hypothetical protein [Donghicola mangrovi]